MSWSKTSTFGVVRAGVGQMLIVCSSADTQEINHSTHYMQSNEWKLIDPSGGYAKNYSHDLYESDPIDLSMCEHGFDRATQLDPTKQSATRSQLQMTLLVDDFVRSLRDLCSRNYIDLAIDKVIDRFDLLLMNVDLATCDGIIRRATSEIEFLDPAVSAAILSMTFVEKDRLAAARIAFYERLFAFLQKTMSGTEAASVLKGLA